MYLFKNLIMKKIYLIFILFFGIIHFSQGQMPFQVQLVVNDGANTLTVNMRNVDSNQPTTSQTITSINMRLLGPVSDIISVASTNYTMQLPTTTPPNTQVITMNSTALQSPENWMMNQWVPVVVYNLNPGSYNASSFSIQPDLDMDNSDVDDPIMSVLTAGLFNSPLVIEGSILPVELIKFSVQADSDHARLHWTTASEYNNAGFEIQRSSDGASFEKIGWEKGVGTSYVLQEYSFSDFNLSPGVYYYRLKQIDNDGDFNFSKVRSVRFDQSSKHLSVYPNPTAGMLYFSDPMEEKGIKVSLFNTQGQLLNCPDIVNNRLDLTQFQAGLYIILIKYETHSEIIKIIKE